MYTVRMSIQYKHKGKREQSDLGPHCLSVRLHTFSDYAL